MAALRGAARCGLRLACAAAPVAPRGALAVARAWPAAAAPRWPMGLGGAAVRFFAAGPRKDGTIKMWNEERGFGFIVPVDGGGDDVFLHRSAAPEGVQLAAGMPVTFTTEWDDKKRKERAISVELSSAAPREAASSPPRSSGGGRPSAHHFVGAVGGWDISRQAMAQADGGSVVRHRLTVRQDAPKSGDKDLKKEEFQIVGDASWDKRLYPEGPDREETVILRPGAAGSRAAADRGKGHGRNWAVEGRAGEAFDVLFDPETMLVTCERA